MRKILLSALALFGFTAFSYSQCADFYDGFESGSYTPTWTPGGSFTSQQVVSTQAAVGTYSFQGIGGSSNHLNGVSTSFTNATPSSISWYIYPTGSNSSNYVVLTDGSSTNASDCIAFVYWRGAGNTIRFYVSAANVVDYPATTNQWYHLEMRNINWTAHTYDIYINGVLQQTGFPFRNTTHNSVGEVFLYNFSSGTTGYWDEIVIGNGNMGLSFATTNPGCYGDTTGSIDMTVTGGTPGYSYAWNTTDTTEDASNIGAGTYSVLVTDQNGCTATDSIVITEPGPLVLTQMNGNPTTCAGTEGYINSLAGGGTPGYDFMWSNGDSTANITGLMAGTYQLHVTDTNGCMDSLSVTLTDPTPTPASLTLAEDTACINYSALTLSGGSPMGGTWSGPGVSGTSFDPSTATAGSHTISYVYTDSANCSDTATATMVVLECLSVDENEGFSFDVYPNPTSGMAIVHMNNVSGNTQLELYSIAGNKIISTIVSEKNYTLNMENLSDGIYILQITSDKQSWRKKIIKR